MKNRKSSLASIAYLLAVGLILVSGAWYIINRMIDVFITVGLSLAIVAIAAGVFLDPMRVRRAITGRQARYGSNMVVLSIGFIGILVIVNYLIYRNPIRRDLTEDQQYSLAPETLRVLDELPERVKIRGFYTSTLVNMQEDIRTLLDQYRIHSNGKLDYEFIDPLENPMMADSYGIVRDGSLAVTLGDTTEIIDYVEEQSITEALLKVITPEERKLYFLIGHGERDYTGGDDIGFAQAQRVLQSKNYTITNLNLMADITIPEDADAVIIADPQKSLTQEEVDLLSQYIDQGGSLILLAEPGTNSLGEDDPLQIYLKMRWGIEIQDNIVVDLDATNYFYGIASLPYISHPITNEIKNLVTFFPTSRGLKLDEMATATLNRIDLVQTGEKSWGETDYQILANGGQLEFDEQADAIGPLTLVVVAEDTEYDARIVVYGDTDFASNSFFFEYGNGDLFVNSIDWAVGVEQLISLTPKPAIQRLVYPPTIQTIGVIFLTTVIVIPGIVIVAGISVWWQRRKRG